MRRGIAFDAELLYAAALFHRIGPTEGQRHRRRRDESDGANVTHAFLFPGGHGVAAEDGAAVWRAIALHAAVGIHPYMTPPTALLGAGSKRISLCCVSTRWAAPKHAKTRRDRAGVATG
ncbi:hypothetical protein [Burkholderia sp. Bp8990]|uniref:hypothetical protein n=1 Tax=Burkholderia sp. Bp8990 TaxID=2184552 RepID=UPI003908A4BB